jgi:hypothetical protein
MKIAIELFRTGRSGVPAIGQDRVLANASFGALCHSAIALMGSPFARTQGK